MKMKQMKIIHLIVLVFLFEGLAGQRYFNLSAETSTGYEYNVFNANVNKVIIIDEVAESALKSGYFQNVNLASSWKIKSKHHEFRLKGNIEKDFFSELKIADLTRSSISAQYKWKLNKANSFSIAGRWNSYMTNRPEDDTEVLSPPRAYERSQLSVKYNIKPIASSNIYLQATVLRNDYRTNEDRTFYYNGLKSTISIRQRLFNSSKHSHYWSLKADYSKRSYLDTTYDDLEDEEIIKEREWKYYRLSSEYDWNIKKKLKMTIGMNATERQDILQDRFGYRQYQPFLEFTIYRKRLDVSFKGSVARREYHTLKASRDSDVALRHDYFRGSLKVKYSISKNFHLILNSRVVRRSRNMPEGAASFLSYDNAIVSLGVRYNVF